MTAIPIEQTTTLGAMTPVTFALLVTDILHMYRPTGGTPADYEVTIEQLRDFFTANMLAVTDVTDSLTSTETQKPGSANQLRVLKDLIDALDGVVAGKLDASAYNEHYKGTYASGVQLSTTHPTAAMGDYAIVDLGVGQPSYVYTWDEDDGIWVQGSPMSPGSTDVLAEGTTNLYFQAARAIAAGADAFLRYDEPQELDPAQILQALENLGIAEFVNRPVGQVRKWEPETEYWEAGATEPPNMVIHDDQLYIVLKDFTSGLDFSVVDAFPSDLALRRLRAATDVDYVEVTASGIAPLVVGQRVGQYLCSKRGVSFFLNHALPVPEVNNTLETLHVAKCNTGITGPVVVDIKRCNHGGGADQVIGTITINDDNTGTYNYGVFAFNDPLSPNPTTELWVGNWDMIYFELSTVPSGLSWIAITLLGQTQAFDDPTWNLPV